MKNELVKFETPELQAIEQSKAIQIKAIFEPMAEMLAKFEEAYNGVVADAAKEITIDVTAKAKRLRLDIGKVRIETEKARKEQKEEYLRAGKAIDGVSNILKWAVVEKETKLKEIEDFFQIQEQKRLSELQEFRAQELASYVLDANERDLSGMDEDVWSAYLSTKKREYEDRITAEKKAEEDRIEREKAEAEERERIRRENEQLKKEAEEQSRLAKIEADKREKEEIERNKRQEAERKQREEKERKVREEYEAKLKAEREERIRVEQAEKEKREKLETEARQRREADRKKEEEKAALIQSELSKDDSDKVTDLINDLSSLKSKYSFKSAANKKMYEEVNLLIDKVIGHIKKVDTTN